MAIADESDTREIFYRVENITTGITVREKVQEDELDTLKTALTIWRKNYPDNEYRVYRVEQETHYERIKYYEY